MLRLHGAAGRAARDAHDHLDGRWRRRSRRCSATAGSPTPRPGPGHFFRVFAATHPTGDFPHRSLLLISGLATLACLADLETVIAALLTSRILIQFVGQIATVFYLRPPPRAAGRLPFRMPFFPLPALIALAGWLYVFGTSQWLVIAYGLGSLALGVAAFLVWDRLNPRPIAEPEQGPGD